MVRLVHVLVPMVIHTFGTASPQDVLAPVPKLAIDIVHLAQGQPVDDKKLVADLVPIGVAASNYFLPGLGIGLSLWFELVKHSRPMTFEEEQKWMQQYNLQE